MRRITLLPLWLLLLVGSLFWAESPTRLQSQAQPIRPLHIALETYSGQPEQFLLAYITVAPPTTTIGAASVLAPPPDWSRLAFQSYRDANWDIYMIAPNGATEVRVTNAKAIDLEPALARGAQQVAFISNLNKQDDFALYRANSDGTAMSALTKGEADDALPRWSPDNSQLVFQSRRKQNTDVVRINADGTRLVQLTNGAAFDGQPDWSNDGNRIVFVSNRTGNYELWTMATDGSALQQVTQGAQAALPAWSPRGDKIAYANDSNGDGFYELWQIDANGANAEKLLDNGQQIDRWSPSWSPDGKWLAYQETLWTQQNGQWFWVASYLGLVQVATRETLMPITDNRVWRPHWGTTDAQAPGPCTVNVVPKQTSASFVLTFSAQDIGPAGVAGFEASVRSRPGQPWQLLPASEGATTLLHQGGEGTQEFRCRAYDAAANVTPWSDLASATTVVDSLPPVSQSLALASLVRGKEVSVQWNGADGGSGIASYDLWQRIGATGDWQLWQAEVTTTTALFTGQNGQRYAFRSQARDRHGNLEPWQPAAQSEVLFYNTLLTTHLSDNRGHRITEQGYSITPPVAWSQAHDEPGSRLLYLSDAPTHTLVITAAGRGTLPAAHIGTMQDSEYRWVAPPQDEQIVNGGFEAGSLIGWAGTGSALSLGLGHTGGYAAQLQATDAEPASLQQTIFISNSLQQPTLSFFLQRAPLMPDAHFTVSAGDALSTTILYTTTATTDAWQHHWVDLTPFRGKSITLTFALTGGTGVLWLDEVSVGSWVTPLPLAVTPVRWPGIEPATLTITGINFLLPAQVYLNQIPLTTVVTGTSTQLFAHVPPGLAAGRYDLTVVNSTGASGVLAKAVTSEWQQLFLPLIVRSPANLSRASTKAEWPAARHNLAHTGYNAADPGGSRYTLAWSTASLGPINQWGKPLQLAIADEKVVAISSATFQVMSLVTFQATDGTRLWQKEIRNVGNGVSAPTLAHDTIYYMVNNHSADTYLYAISLENGEQYWRFPINAQWQLSVIPIVVGNQVFVYGGYTGGLYSVAAGSGARHWFSWLENYEDYAPAFADNRLYTLTRYGFRAIDPATGQTLRHAESVPFDGVIAPVIAEGMALISTGSALSLDTHAIQWSTDGGKIKILPATADGIVYRVTEAGVQALRLRDGALLWAFTLPESLLYDPVVAGNYLYVASANTTYVLNRITRQLVWQSSPGGALAVANGFLYVGTADNRLYAFRAQAP